MKKLLLLLLCVPFIGLTQSNIKVDVIEFVDKESNIWIYTFPNQNKLLKKEHNKYKDSILYEEGSNYSLYDYTLRENISKEYFNVDKILEVYIYNYKSDILGIARYEKTVYVNEAMNGPSYYHIFKISDITSINPSVYFTMEDLKSEKSAYFISTSPPKNNNMEIKEYNNTGLDSIFILEYTRGNDEYEISHFELLDGNRSTIYSRVTICDHDGGFSKSYIIETKNGLTNILHTVSDCIWDAIPTKIFINNKPVFVGSSGMWEYYPAKWILK
jgi:hypothetical protein